MRFFLDREGRMRDRALFDLAIDSKLRGCDLVKMKIGTLVTATKFELVQWSTSKRLDAPCSSRLRPRSELVYLPGCREGEERSMTMPFPVASTTIVVRHAGVFGLCCCKGLIRQGGALVSG